MRMLYLAAAIALLPINSMAQVPTDPAAVDRMAAYCLGMADVLMNAMRDVPGKDCESDATLCQKGLVAIGTAVDMERKFEGRLIARKLSPGSFAQRLWVEKGAIDAEGMAHAQSPESVERFMNCGALYVHLP